MFVGLDEVSLYQFLDRGFDHLGLIERYVGLWAEEFDSGAEIVEYLLETYLLTAFDEPYYSCLEEDVSVLLNSLDELALLFELFSVVTEAFLRAVPIYGELIPD